VRGTACAAAGLFLAVQSGLAQDKTDAAAGQSPHDFTTHSLWQQSPTAASPQNLANVTTPPGYTPDGPSSVSAPDAAAPEIAIDASPPKIAIDAPQPVNAVWVERKVSFTYFAARTFYSCDGFRNKVRYVLLKIGALPQSLSIVANCNGSMGVQSMSGAHITAAMPMAVTPELMATIEREAPRRDLIRRVRGEKPFDLAAAQFPAAWTTVEFDGHHDRHALDGDCDLVSQMTRSLFPPLGVRLTADTKMRCSEGTMGTVKFKAESLQPVQLPERPAFSSKQS